MVVFCLLTDLAIYVAMTVVSLLKALFRGVKIKIQNTTSSRFQQSYLVSEFFGCH